MKLYRVEQGGKSKFLAAGGPLHFLLIKYGGEDLPSIDSLPSVSPKHAQISHPGTNIAYMAYGSMASPGRASLPFSLFEILHRPSFDIYRCVSKITKCCVCVFAVVIEILPALEFEQLHLLDIDDNLKSQPFESLFYSPRFTGIMLDGPSVAVERYQLFIWS